LYGQKVEAKLNFLQDSAFVGEVMRLDFVIQHPPEVAIAFPDSGPVFKPFEVVKMEPRLTQTRESVSHDTLSIYLRTFFLFPEQYIQLPFSYFALSDTFYGRVRSDTVLIRHQIFSLAPPPPLKSREGIIPISTPPDYRMWAIVGLISLLLGLGVILGLRKPVKQFLTRRKLTREWQVLSKNMKQLNKIQDKPDTFLDLLNQYWKSYLDPRHHFSLRSLSTKELVHQISRLEEVSAPEQKALLEVAQIGDLAIYAGQSVSKDHLKKHQKAVQKILSQVFKNRLKAVSA
jgi:hypothetical protein